MNSPESAPEQDQSNLSAEVVAMQKQVFVLLVALIVITGTFAAYLYRQTSILGKEIDAVRPLANAFDANQPVYKAFLEQVGTYGQAHPEFRPVLIKNGLVPVSSAPAPQK
jgi:hypothetical protein